MAFAPNQRRILTPLIWIPGSMSVLGGRHQKRLPARTVRRPGRAGRPCGAFGRVPGARRRARRLQPIQSQNAPHNGIARRPPGVYSRSTGSWLAGQLLGFLSFRRTGRWGRVPLGARAPKESIMTIAGIRTSPGGGWRGRRRCVGLGGRRVDARLSKPLRAVRAAGFEGCPDVGRGYRRPGPPARP